jgi:4'-phosphopantetheinyl transferase
MEWSRPPAKLQLDKRYIDVWQSPVRLPAEQLEKYANSLSAEERQRAAKFAIPDKYEEYVVSHGLLRKSLAHVLGRAVSEFEFDYGASRKPFLKKTDASQNPVFNISHSHGQVLVAISMNRNIGVDIEKIRNNVEYEKLALRFFSAAEHAALMQLPETQRVAAFFATWTRKEAFVKAVGKGIAFGLSEFEVNIDPLESPKMLVTRWDPTDVEKWLLASIETENDYFATVASDGGQFQLRCWQW